MRSALLLLLPAAVRAYFQPGDPPQCFDDYQCNFHRFPSETGLSQEYSWDIYNLCADAGQEYIAALDPRCLNANGTCNCNSCDTTARLRFNVCGTVSGPIAPVAEQGSNGTGSPQQLPLPHSHGVAVQYIEGYPGPAIDPAYGPVGGCADIDTCDQQYNTGCAPGSLNYPMGVNQDDAFYTRRAQRCSDNGQDYCSPYSYWCCSVKPTPCTKSAEVLAYYDGSPPNFNLFNEGSPDGLTLSFNGALPYVDDPFPCSNSGLLDPSTGYAPTRSVTIVLQCDPSIPGLDKITYLETAPCNYIITGSSKYACGTPGDGGSPTLTATSTRTAAVTPSPSASHEPWVPASAADAKAAKAAASASAGAGTGGFFGGVAAGALGAVLFTMWRAGTLTGAVNKAMYGEKIPLMLSPSRAAAAAPGFSSA